MLAGTQLVAFENQLIIKVEQVGRVDLHRLVQLPVDQNFNRHVRFRFAARCQVISESFDAVRGVTRAAPVRAVSAIVENVFDEPGGAITLRISLRQQFSDTRRWLPDRCPTSTTSIHRSADSENAV